MSDPSRAGPPPGTHPDGEPSTGTVESGPADSWRQRYRADATQPERRAWTWTSTRRPWTWTSTRRPVPWFGALILLLGLSLLIEQLIPELSFGSLLVLALGGAFGVVWLVGRVIGATVPALVLTAWALARMGEELGYLPGDGWVPLFVGVGLLAGWVLARFQKVRREWALWLGLILGLIGLADASDVLAVSLDVAVVVPLVLIGLGLVLIWRRRFTLG